MTTHKERVLNQKPTIIVKPLFFKKFWRQILVAKEMKHRFKLPQILYQ